MHDFDLKDNGHISRPNLIVEEDLKEVIEEDSH